MIKSIYGLILHIISLSAITYLVVDRVNMEPRIEVVVIIETPEPQINQRHLNCIARNIYWEARNQPLAGMIAVGHVVLNRTIDGRWPSDPCEVIYQRRGNTCQFEWVCSDKVRREPSDQISWGKSLEAAYLAMTGPDITQGALFFQRGNPPKRQPITRINDHAFFRER